MTIQLHNVTLDCADPRRVAAFWSKALVSQSPAIDAGVAPPMTKPR